MQRYGIDYDETFAPLSKLETLSALLAVAIHLQLPFIIMDIVSAYLNGMKYHNIFKTQATGFVNEDFPDHVLEVERNLYRLKASGREYHLCLTARMLIWAVTVSGRRQRASSRRDRGHLSGNCKYQSSHSNGNVRNDDFVDGSLYRHARHGSNG
jgi:hypothetical protein